MHLLSLSMTNKAVELISKRFNISKKLFALNIDHQSYIARNKKVSIELHIDQYGYDGVSHDFSFHVTVHKLGSVGNAIKKQRFSYEKNKWRELNYHSNDGGMSIHLFPYYKTRVYGVYGNTIGQVLEELEEMALRIIKKRVNMEYRFNGKTVDKSYVIPRDEIQHNCVITHKLLSN